MSPFRSLLDELMKTAAVDEPARGVGGLSWDVLDIVVEFQRAAGTPSRAPRRDVYPDEHAAEHPPIELPPADRRTVAGELGLHPDMTLDDLGRARRVFARRNHPDGLPCHLRDLATARMTTANTLIDEAEAAARRRDGMW